jgi:hypothetical protein
MWNYGFNRTYVCTIENKPIIIRPMLFVDSSQLAIDPVQSGWNVIIAENEKQYDGFS